MPFASEGDPREQIFDQEDTEQGTVVAEQGNLEQEDPSTHSSQQDDVEDEHSQQQSDANKPPVTTRLGRQVKKRVRLIETLLLEAYANNIAKETWNHIPYKIFVQASKYKPVLTHCYAMSLMDPDMMYYHQAMREPTEGNLLQR